MNRQASVKQREGKVRPRVAEGVGTHARSAGLELFARCASGFEGTLAGELKRLGAARVRPLAGGVAFFGDMTCAYRVCLWSRVATRVQLVLVRVGARDAEELYSGVRAFAWEDAIREGATIAVHAQGTNEQLRNSQFVALKVKDALCDRLREQRGMRPSVNASDPDCYIDVSLHRARATVYANLSGPALHRRGYRESGEQAIAPLKETLAAGMLMAAGWVELAAHDAWFVDPLCGSGTLAIEAALIAADRAPGLLRTRWGFSGWAHHDPQVWDALMAQARERAEAGKRALCERLEAGKGGDASAAFFAGDIDGDVLALARRCAESAGVADLVTFYEGDASTLPQQLAARGALVPCEGLLATNPPYGQRLLDETGVREAHESLKEAVEALPQGWSVAVITPDESIDRALLCTPAQVLPCYNGPIEATVRMYELGQSRMRRLSVVSLEGVEQSVPVVEAGSEQFAARLRKVAKERAKWARREGVNCYRIYDADLPDYALAIDCYEAASDEAQPAYGSGRYLRVSEYHAPAEVDAQRAANRFADALALIPAVLDVEPGHVFSKVRRRAKGGSQYREARGASQVVHVKEGPFVFEVDLNGRLDTGLFLDHRVTRGMVATAAKGMRFLNLFAYTGTASVYAAAGGALQTTTVDLSHTYLRWAQRNMQANGFEGPAHRFVRSDVVPWLQEQVAAGTLYDLVFCDPPTFSNSKRMAGGAFDVQRDHVCLLEQVIHVLAPRGTIMFSCNKRNFKLDERALESLGLAVEDCTASTIPHDFERTPKVHRCFTMRRMQP